MSACGRKALTLLSSVFAVCGLGLLGIAVSTDYWLYLEEGVVLPQNQSTEIKMSLHSGLWRVCFLAGKGTRACGQPRPGERSSPSLGKPVQDPPSAHPHPWEVAPLLEGHGSPRQSSSGLGGAPCSDQDSLQTRALTRGVHLSESHRPGPESPT